MYAIVGEYERKRRGLDLIEDVGWPDEDEDDDLDYFIGFEYDEVVDTLEEAIIYTLDNGLYDHRDIIAEITSAGNEISLQTRNTACMEMLYHMDISYFLQIYDDATGSIQYVSPLLKAVEYGEDDARSALDMILDKIEWKNENLKEVIPIYFEIKESTYAKEAAMYIDEDEDDFESPVVKIEKIIAATHLSDLLEIVETYDDSLQAKCINSFQLKERTRELLSNNNLEFLLLNSDKKVIVNALRNLETNEAV